MLHIKVHKSGISHSRFSTNITWQTEHQ